MDVAAVEVEVNVVAPGRRSYDPDATVSRGDWDSMTAVMDERCSVRRSEGALVVDEDTVSIVLHTYVLMMATANVRLDSMRHSDERHSIHSMGIVRRMPT